MLGGDLHLRWREEEGEGGKSVCLYSTQKGLSEDEPPPNTVPSTAAGAPLCPTFASSVVYSQSVSPET